MHLPWGTLELWSDRLQFTYIFLFVPVLLSVTKAALKYTLVNNSYSSLSSLSTWCAFNPAWKQINICEGIARLYQGRWKNIPEMVLFHEQGHGLNTKKEASWVSVATLLLIGMQGDLEYLLPWLSFQDGLYRCRALQGPRCSSKRHQRSLGVPTEQKTSRRPWL